MLKSILQEKIDFFSKKGALKVSVKKMFFAFDAMPLEKPTGLAL